jgi:hypothetical protein
MRYNECPLAMDESRACDSVGIRAHKGRVWITVVGLFLSLLSLLIISPHFLPEKIVSIRSPFFSTPMFLTFFCTTPPLALVANAIAMRYGRSRVLGVIGLLFSVAACVVWAMAVFLCVSWML